MNTIDLWQLDLTDKVYTGFSDLELLRLCEPDAGGVDLLLPNRKSPYLYFPSCVYSFGWCFRDWINWPKWLPLPIYFDHGVNTYGILERHELISKPKTHITWFRDRAECLKKLNQKKVLRVMHPWVVYRRKNNLIKKHNSRGTLIFYAHSTGSAEIMNYDWDKYFSDLKSLPESYHPLVICMHQNDIKKCYAGNVRKYNIPIVTVGSTESQYFIDRFYDLIANFTYATSQIGGSELFYCEEIGVKYFIKGGELAYYIREDKDEILRVFEKDLLAVKVNKLKKEIFKDFSPPNILRRKELVTSVLGLDLDEIKCKNDLKRLVYLESLRHFREVALGSIIFITPKSLKRFLRFIFETVVRCFRF